MKPKVLIVDDDGPARFAMGEVLGDDYDVLEARDGEEGVDLARRERPEFVLLDVTMPRMDGLAACRLLKSDPATRGSVVIIISGRGQPEDQLRGLVAGADAYLTKPFSPAKLWALLADTRQRL